MKATLYMAMSVNGYIADPDGGEGFLSSDGWNGLVELATNAGVIIIGRTTYEVVKKNYTNFGFLDVAADRIIVTSNPDFTAPDGYSVARSPQAALDLAAAQGHREAVLTGGAKLNSSFMTANLIDQVVLQVEPAVIGTGIPLFAPAAFARRLRYQSVIHRGDGILRLYYTIGDKIV